jgi:hypothetical protein
MSALPLLLTSLQAASLCGVSRSTFNQWVAEGRIPPEVIDTPQYGGWKTTRHLPPAGSGRTAAVPLPPGPAAIPEPAPSAAGAGRAPLPAA